MAACQSLQRAGLPHIVYVALRRVGGGREHNGALATACIVSHVV